MSAFFERLQRAVRLYENNATAYLRTHPLTGERLTDMQNREQPVGYRQMPDSVDFQLVRAKLRAMQGTPREAIKDFETLLSEKKYAAEAALAMDWPMRCIAGATGRCGARNSGSAATEGFSGDA
jgi:predicted Zn-dependent protease